MDIENPLISIIIPVYNVEKYLVQCLDSVLNQTYNNIEVICVDDGSSDQSPELLHQYQKKHPNLYVYLQEYNQGQGAARNVGLQRSLGDFILFVDSDDFIEIDTVSYLVKKIQETNVDFIRFNAKSFSSEGQLVKENSYSFSQYLTEDKIYSKQEFKNVYLSFMPSPVLYMFKRELFIDNNIAFPTDIIHEDEVFTAMIFLYASNCLYVNKFFYNRRYRTGSTMTEKSEAQTEKSYNSYIKIIKIYNKILETSELSSTQQFFLEYRINSIYHPLLKSSKTEQQRKTLENLKEDKRYYSSHYKNYIRFLKAISIIKNKIL